MKKIYFLFIPVLILDILAIHDILKGVEPDYTEEYTCLAFSLIIFLFVLYRYKITKKKSNG